MKYMLVGGNNLNFVDVNYYRNKIERHFNLINRDSSEEFLPSLAIFFDFLCEDPIIRSMLGQILKRLNKPEDYLMECVEDISKLLNMFIKECVVEINHLGKLKDLIRFELRDPEKETDNIDNMLPLSIIITKENDLVRIEKELHVTDSYNIVQSKFKGLEDVISHFNLNIRKISRKVELNFEDWRKPSYEFINLELLNFNNISSTREELEQRQLSYNSAFQKLKSLVGLLKTPYKSIETLSRQNTKTDLLEIISYLNYNFPYLNHVNNLVRDNSCIIKYGRADYRSLIVEKSKIMENFSYTEWESKLNRILSHLYTLIDSTWYIKTLLDRYLMKTTEYGWARLARSCEILSQPMDEKLLQFDLAEYLFDHGITTVVEKVAGNDRLDIMTFDENSTIMEVKFFRNINDLTYVFQGITQTLKYTQIHGKTIGYYIVFQSCVSHSLELVKEFTIGGVTIFLLSIDITGNSGRNDNRERIDLNDAEFRNFITFKDKSFNKQWNNVTLSDFLLIDDINATTALKIIAQKSDIKDWSDLKKNKRNRL